MMKAFIFSKICLLTAMLTLVAPSLYGAAENDFEFYKDHGHRNKLWNESVKMGFEAYDRQDCETAVRYLKEAVGAQAKDALVYYKLAVCTEMTGSPYTAMQYYQLAQESLQSLTAIHRYQQEIFESYGRALFKAKKYAEALPYLTRAAAVGAPSFGLYYMVGYLYAQKKDYTAALDYFQRAITQDITDVPPELLSEVYYQVAQSHYQKKDYKNAMSMLDKAVQLNPQNEPAINLRNQTQTALQQSSIVEMIENLSEEKTQGTQQAPAGQQPPSGQQPPTSQPPPPAASKLPPLEGASPQGPTTTPAQNPTGSTPSTSLPEDRLAPLPPQ